MALKLPLLLGEGWGEGEIPLHKSDRSPTQGYATILPLGAIASESRVAVIANESEAISWARDCFVAEAPRNAPPPAIWDGNALVLHLSCYCSAGIVSGRRDYVSRDSMIGVTLPRTPETVSAA